MAVETCQPSTGSPASGGNANTNTSENVNGGAAPSTGLQECPAVYQIPPPNCADESLLNNSLDNCYANTVANEVVAKGGTDIYVYKLMGIHEQGKLLDLTGNGKPISGGDSLGFPNSHAFTAFASEWKSVQKGQGVLASAYIGYDFGEIKLDNERRRYGISTNSDTSVKYNISTIKLKQGTDELQRATKIRVERSDDGIAWYGAALLDIANSCDLVTLSFNHTVPSRYWRIRPVAFNGAAANDVWAVSALQMIDYQSTHIYNIQDHIFQENRDRDYAQQAIKLKGTYDVTEIQTDITQFGINIQQQMYFQFPFSSVVAGLGRPIVIGDIFEVPSEAQYSELMKRIPKLVEVTDVGWSVDGYTAGWVPTILKIAAAPLLASQETQDVVGTLAQALDDIGLSNIDDGSHPLIQDYSVAEQVIKAAETTIVPERGADTADHYVFNEDQIALAAQQGINLRKLNILERGLYVEDGIPPNGLPYTEGPAYPANPSNGAYHRMTYVGTATGIPPRLFRYSVAKNRWVYVETDRRLQHNETKPLLQEFLGSATRTPNRLLNK